MNQIELYDILTLNNNDKYSVIAMTTKENKNYALLVGVDENENPLPNKVRIVEITNNNSIKEIEDKNLLKIIGLELSKKSVEELESDK